jgi:hypothetical protein
MHISKLLPAAALSLPLLALCASCSNGCETTREAYCTCELRSTTNTTLRSLSVWALSDRFEGGDSIMIDGESSPTSISLILDPDATETRLRIQFNATADHESLQETDTLTLRYEPYPYFIDMECGCSVHFELKEAECTYHFLQDLYLTNATVTNDQTINIRLEY